MTAWLPPGARGPWSPVGVSDAMFDDDEEGFAELEASTWVACPYCGEEVELLVDPGGGPVQDYVEDCEVCCQPWRIHLRILPDGTPQADVSTLDEG